MFVRESTINSKHMSYLFAKLVLNVHNIWFISAIITFTIIHLQLSHASEELFRRLISNSESNVIARSDERHVEVSFSTSILCAYPDVNGHVTTHAWNFMVRIIIIIIIIITTTIFIVLSSTAPAICKSSLWFLWWKVGQRQVAANS